MFQIDNMKLIYDNTTRTTRNVDGVKTRIQGWEDPSALEYLLPTRWFGAYFSEISKMLRHELGYARRESLFAAPYDFRKGPCTFFLLSYRV